MIKPLLECYEIVKRLGSDDQQTVAVDHASFHVLEGEAIALVGPSGGGKSTLLSLLGLMLDPSSGLLEVNGVAAPETDAARALMRNDYFGYVHQNYAVVPAQSALWNTSIPLDYARPRVTKSERRKRASAVLAQVGLGDKAQRQAGGLSGGERQRVAIARSLVNNPRVVLADEPTASLDSATGLGVINLLLAMRSRGGAVVIATHDPRVADRCDRVVAIRDGRLEHHSVR